MNKSSKFLLFSIVLVIFAFIYRANVGDVGFASSYTAKADMVVSSGSTIKCQIDGNVDEKFATMVENELNSIPANLRAKFIKDGWHIYVTNENLAKLYYGDEYAIVYGSTFYDKGLILMYGNSTAIAKATIHEFGHWFDDELGTISETYTFNKIYKAEKNAFESVFYRGIQLDNREYFAEAFYFYIKNPTQLKNTAPQTYNFMVNIITGNMQD